MLVELAFKLLGVIYAEVSPGLKAAALAELQTLAAKESGNAVIQQVLKIAEAFLAVVPEVLPG